MAKAEWQPSSIDALVFVSQTPDYVLPATSCCLHDRLRLAKSCACFDVNLGCSGYAYGLWLASSLLAAGGASRVLLLAGDTISRTVSPEDRSVALIFGDAGSATLLEKRDGWPSSSYVLGSDGRGRNNLIVPAGKFRQPAGPNTTKSVEQENGNRRSPENLYMDGAEIFTFALREVPSLFENLFEVSGWEPDEVDAYVLHQANRFMIDHLRKRMKLPKEKVVLALEQYGNTSVASIPLAMTTTLAGELTSRELRLLLAGFGVGYSWGGAAIHCGPMIVPDVIEVPEPSSVTVR